MALTNGVGTAVLQQDEVYFNRRASVASTSSASLSAFEGGSVSSRKQRLRLLIVRHGETDYNVKGIIQGQMDTDLNAVGRQQAKSVADALAQEHVDEVYASPLRRARDTATAIVAAHPNFAVGRLPYWLDNRLKERGFGSLEGKTFDRSKPKRDSVDGIEQMRDFGSRLALFVASVVAQSAPFTTNGGEELGERVTYLAKECGVNLGNDNNAHPGPPPKLNRANCTRTVVLVAHGAAISALLGAVLLENNLACMSAGVQRTRVWNCSITEVIVHEPDSLPRFVEPTTGCTLLNLELLSQRDGKKAFVIERWADVRHLPDNLDDAVANKGAADEMVGRQTE